LHSAAGRVAGGGVERGWSVRGAGQTSGACSADIFLATWRAREGQCESATGNGHRDVRAQRRAGSECWTSGWTPITRITNLGISLRRSGSSYLIRRTSRQSIMLITTTLLIDAWLLISHVKAATGADQAYCSNHYRGHELSVPDFFDGPPSDLVEDIPSRDGWHFGEWAKEGVDHYIVCHYGPSLKITRRVQKGATACLFGDGKKTPAVFCK
jgi:hypothetical protein